MTALLALLRILVGLFVIGSASVAILAVLGFASGALDVLNSLQIAIFPATLLGLILVALVFGPGPRSAFLIALAATGFIASSSAFVPEVVRGFAPRPAMPVDGSAVLKVMTHNLFGLNYDMKRVAQGIFAEDPDIVALQEFFPEQRRPLHPLLLAHYPYFAYCTGGKRANIALYAKLPFTETAAGACTEKATQAVRTSRIVGHFRLADGTEFSVMTTHLDSPFNAPRQHAQMAELAAAAAAVRGPLLLMGDFNATPWSYALRRFEARSGLERQTRNLVTWPLLFGGDDGLIRMIPFLPLDHVFTRGVAVHRIGTAPADGSDHLPVVFLFSVKD
jgi:endonuclease/exonuclease/phosphatase (EEP) superfamily protein YafD